jgi:hypothetical protein
MKSDDTAWQQCALCIAALIDFNGCTEFVSGLQSRCLHKGLCHRTKVAWRIARDGMPTGYSKRLERTSTLGCRCCEMYCLRARAHDRCPVSFGSIPTMMAARLMEGGEALVEESLSRGGRSRR